jgi:DNA-binding NtrC family response regulator
MMENMAVTTIHEAPVGAELNCGYVFAKPLRANRFPRRLNSPCALVVSTDEFVQQNLADTITQCGLFAFRAFTVGESKRILGRQEICLLVCDDRPIDGTYEDLLQAARASRTKPPVIVVSFSGGWPEYLKALDAGVFDFLAYPPIRGELPRTVHRALEGRALRSFNDADVAHSEFLAGGRR